MYTYIYCCFSLENMPLKKHRKKSRKRWYGNPQRKTSKRDETVTRSGYSNYINRHLKPVVQTHRSTLCQRGKKLFCPAPPFAVQSFAKSCACTDPTFASVYRESKDLQLILQNDSLTYYQRRANKCDWHDTNSTYFKLTATPSYKQCCRGNRCRVCS